jgi:hypothetical protein
MHFQTIAILVLLKGKLLPVFFVVVDYVVILNHFNEKKIAVTS